MQSSKMEENLYSVMERRSYVELANNGGYFSKFEWLPDSYSSFQDELTKRRIEQNNAQKDVHGQAPFLSNPKRSIPHRHESTF